MKLSEVIQNYFSLEETLKYLDISKNTLKKIESTGLFPPKEYISKQIFYYSKPDVESFKTKFPLVIKAGYGNSVLKQLTVINNDQYA